MDGWDEVDAFFRQEIIDNKKAINIPTDGLTNEMIAREVQSRKIAGKIVEKCLQRLNAIRSGKDIQKQSYK